MYNFSGAGSQYIHKINGENFEDIALALFRYQFEENPVYRRYCQLLHSVPGSVSALTDIPFLPISFFKTHTVTSAPGRHPLTVFESSGTTGDISRHGLYRKALYETSALRQFRIHYGRPEDYVILALLPSYLERGQSSLVYMADLLIRESGHPESAFYLNEWDKLYHTIQALEAGSRRALLLGVTFALLDFSDRYPMRLEHTTVMETGGMKGRREELTRDEVHRRLKERWSLEHIHSEYGMTELCSQAYAPAEGLFYPAPTMKVLSRDVNDPLDVRESGSGVLNIIDLANVDSCAFIGTEDLGNVYPDGRFQVLGRLDNSALRGCSLMVV